LEDNFPLSENQMNKKYIAYIVLGMVLLGTIATLSISMVSAQGGTEIQTGDQWQGQQDGNGEQFYRFQQRTRVRINSSQNVHLNMSVEAMNIGDRTFSLDIDAEEEFEMNMWLVRDQDRLGVQNGSTIRNQNRHQVRNNFAAQIQVNLSSTFQARIGMEMTRGDALRASWAYFDDGTDEWVEVESSYEDGMLVAETDHFSVWTIVESPSLLGLWIGIGVGVVAIGAIAVILIRKKRM
jgi:hypothetical protein